MKPLGSEYGGGNTHKSGVTQTVKSEITAGLSK